MENELSGRCTSLTAHHAIARSGAVHTRLSTTRQYAARRRLAGARTSSRSSCKKTHQQRYAIFVNKRQAVGRLVAIDALFVKVSTGWLNPTREIEAMLLLPANGPRRVFERLS